MSKLAFCRWTLSFKQTGFIDGNVILILCSPNKTREECDRFRTRREPTETIQEERGRNGIIGEVKERKKNQLVEKVSVITLTVHMSSTEELPVEGVKTRRTPKEFFVKYFLAGQSNVILFEWISRELIVLSTLALLQRESVWEVRKEESERNRKIFHFHLLAPGQKTKEDDVESGQASPFDKFVSNNRKAIG